MDKQTEREFERVYLKGKREGIKLRNRGQIFAWGLMMGAISAYVVMVMLLVLLL